MVDLISIKGGKKDEPEDDGIEPTELYLIRCAKCEGGLFNWHTDDSSTMHLFGCATCGSTFPVVSADSQDFLEYEDFEEWD